MDGFSVSDLVPEESALFHGSTVDFSSASRFHQRHIKIASQLPEHVVRVGENQYELSPKILERLVLFRHMGARNEQKQPADRLAGALLDCAKSLALELSLLKERTKEEIWAEYFDAVKAHGPIFLRAQKSILRLPVSKDGSVLEPFSHPELPQLNVHLVFNTDLASVPFGKYTARVPIPKTIDSSPAEHVNSREFTIERLPELTIRLEGAPVVKMMVASFDKKADEIDLARQFTSKMLNGVMHELKRFLGMVSKRGRPRLGIGEKAALLLHHHRKNITQATEELCPNRSDAGHHHTKRCQDRVRLAADQHYKSVERDLLRYLPVTSRKT